MIETFDLEDADGQTTARLVGSRVLSVDPSAPCATLPVHLSQGPWRSDVAQRIEALTGKFRAVNMYLAAT